MTATRTRTRKRVATKTGKRAIDVGPAELDDERLRQSYIQRGTIEVSRVHKCRGKVTSEENLSETITVPQFHTTPGHVQVEGSVTRNMGNFNSVKIGVTVQLPCYPEETEVEECYLTCSEMVDEKVKRELELACGVNNDAG